MSARRALKSGFTLVEILIVVVILGILAAVVIPQFTNASESARAASLTSQLQTIRSQLELAQIEHDGYYPDLLTNWNFMTQATLPESGADGEYTLAGDDDENIQVGPYLQKAPLNPFVSTAVRTTVVATEPSNLTTAGWFYNQSTGQIKAVISEDKGLELRLIEEGDDTDSSADFVIVAE